APQIRAQTRSRVEGARPARERCGRLIAARAHPVLATFSIRTARSVSGRLSVVVMEAIEDWQSHNTTDSLGHSRHRLFLQEALVWPSLVVEASVLRDKAQKMALAQHEDMVEQFAPESADKALGEGVHVRGPEGGANDLGADGFEQTREPSTQLGVAIDDEYFGLDVPTVCFAPAEHTSHRTARG